MMGDPGLPSTPRRRNRSTARSSAVTCRLERLAQPRSSSAWKRPIQSKYSQRQGADDGARLRLDFSKHGGSVPKELADVRKVLKTWKKQLSPKLPKDWKDHISPKLRHPPQSTLKSRLASRLKDASYILQLEDSGYFETDVSPSDHKAEACNKSGNADSPYSGNHSEDNVQESASNLLSMPIIKTFLNHPFHLSCPPTHVVEFSARALQREVRKLADELATKEGQITKLRKEATEQENVVANLTTENRRLSERQATPTQDAVDCREMSLYRAVDAESVVSSTAVPRMSASRDPRQSSEVLAPGLVGEHKEAGGRVERARKRGRGDIDYYIDESYALHDELDSVGDLRLVLTEELKSKMEFMSVEHDLLRQDVQRLRRSSAESIRLASNDLNYNFKKIMNYVREEESGWREGIHDLQSDLERAWKENSRLEAALREAENEKSRLKVWKEDPRLETALRKAKNEKSRLGDCGAKCEQEKTNVQDPPEKDDDAMPAGSSAGRGTWALYQSIIVALMLALVVSAMVAQLALRLEEFHFGAVNPLIKVPAYLVVLLLGVTVWWMEEKVELDRYYL